MSWRRFCKTSSRHFEDVFARCLENVLKTFSEDLWVRWIYSPWSRCLEDVFWRRRRRTSSRSLHQDECLLVPSRRRLQDVLKTFLQDVLKTCWRCLEIALKTFSEDVWVMLEGYCAKPWKSIHIFLTMVVVSTYLNIPSTIQLLTYYLGFF